MEAPEVEGIRVRVGALVLRLHQHFRVVRALKQSWQVARTRPQTRGIVIAAQTENEQLKKICSAMETILGLFPDQGSVRRLCKMTERASRVISRCAQALKNMRRSEAEYAMLTSQKKI